MMRPLFAVLAASLAASSPAWAQQRPAPPAATSPERTSATYGDWVMRCETRTAPATGRGCELLQSLQDQRGQPVAQFALGRIHREDPMRLVVLIPSNITIAVPMRLSLGDGGAAVPVTLKACGPRGCVADTELGAALLTRMRARETRGQLEYRDALNAEVALPFSTRGLGQALDALGREGF
ncbi:invasion associated locus B family protein [Roseococcus sp.]|uniref:invasion associated locus B family protein n=1 Tax=Roseococcus sp. TaxID=2109646 RepID=UPI003BACE2F0